jgi:hypothetical protein
MGWRRARSWSTAALGVSLSFSSALGWASEPTAEERVEKLRDQAFAALSSRRFGEAADRFREAWELGNDFWDICNLGRAEMDLGRWREAVEHLAICLKVMPEDQRPEFGERFERFYKEALAEVGALSMKANGPSADVRPSETKSEVVPASTPEAAPAPKRDAGPSLREPPAPGPRVSAKEPVQDRTQPKTALLVTGSALGIVGAVAGMGGFWVAETASDDAEAMTQALKKTGLDFPCYVPENGEICRERERKITQIAPFTTLGAGGLVLAGTGVALIVYELVRASSDNAKGGPNAAFIVTPRGGALGLTGTF